LQKNFKLKNALPYIITALFGIVFMLVIYAVSGIYPFGEGTVIADDMAQQTIPNYTYFWDFMHSGGKLSLLFNWQTGGGIQSLSTGFYIFKPWEVIFSLLVTRDGIINGISFLLIFKFVMAAISMLVFLRRRFNLPAIWQIILSLTYAFSAFLLVYYANMGWIDAAFIFPFIILAALHMKDTGKWMPYVIILSYSLLLSIYTSFMVFMFLLLIGGLYIILLVDKEIRKMTIVRFGLSSLASLALSAVINIPTVYYMLGSSRQKVGAERTESSFLTMLGAENLQSRIKTYLIVGLAALLWAFFLMLIFKSKGNKKRTVFYVVSAALLVIPAAIEGINLIWHLGSYTLFPLRYVYMLTFLLICGAASVYQEGLPECFIAKKKALSIIAIPVALAFGAGGIYLLVTKILKFGHYTGGLIHNNVFEFGTKNLIIASFFLLLACYFLLLLIRYKKLASVLIAVVLLTETALFAFVCLDTNHIIEDENSAYSVVFEEKAKEVHDNLGLESDHITRIKDKDIRLNSNYPQLINYPAMSNFTHITSANLAISMTNLGYSQVYTRIYENSGTLLSDALLNIDYVMSSKDENEEEYTYIKDITDEVKLYKNNCNLPVGLIVNDDFVNVDIAENEAVFENTDALYKALGGKKNLFDTKLYNFEVEVYETYTVVHEIKGRKHVYIDIDYDEVKDKENLATHLMCITLNGDFLDLSSFDEQYAVSIYPTASYTNILDLGVFEDETIELEFELIGTLGDRLDITVAETKPEELLNFCNSDIAHGEVEIHPQSVSATAVCENEGSYMFLPITNDPGWSAKVNGKKVNIVNAMGAFIAVPLETGENEIDLFFLPYGMKLGGLVTILTLIIVLVVYFYFKKHPIANDKDNKLLRIIDKLFTVGIIVVIVVIYFGTTAISIYYNYILNKYA
jgi:uncharacterized membrane protein YfhO